MLRLSTLFLCIGTMLIWTGCTPAAPPVEEGTVVLLHATVIDGTGKEPIPDAVMILKDDRITAIGPAGTEYPEGAPLVDLTGKTVMPGIINLHGHVGMVKGMASDAANYTKENAESQLKTYARYGVTTTTSLGTDLDPILDIIGHQKQGHFSGSRVFTALQGFTYREGYPTQSPGVKGVALEVGSPEEARQKVDELAGRGAHVIKMWVDDHHDRIQKIPPEVYTAIIEQAHQHGLKVFAHLYELEDAKGLVRAGLDVMAHSVRDAEVDDELIQLLLERKTTAVPTLTREQSTFVYADSPAWLEDPFLNRSVSPEVIEVVKTSLKATQEKDPEGPVNRAGFDMAMRNLKKLADAGVPIGFGSDSGPPARFQGFFEHWEIELMAQAGLTPQQVIQSFSQNAAQALGLSDRLGTLSPGKQADFVVLDANPLEDIRNTRSIHAVYLAGKKID